MKRTLSLIILVLSIPWYACAEPEDTLPSTEPSEVTKSASPDAKGFVSKKTGKSFSTSDIEDITNENFPDMIESFDYPDADIREVIAAISELTRKNFVVDPQVHGKISIIAPTRLTVAEAYKVFLSALAINGLAVVPGDGFLKVKLARAAQRDNIDTFSGKYYPTADQMITRIIRLKFVSADEVNKQLHVLASKDGELVVYTPTNSLIISDYGSNIDRIMKIIEQLDVKGFEEQMEVIQIRYARAKEISDLVDQIINKGDKKNNQFAIPRFRPGEPTGGGSGAEVYSVVLPDERTNSIIVVGNHPGIEKIRHLVERLDHPLRTDDQGGFFVYYLRHADAEPIATMLSGVATESKKSQDQSSQPRGGGATTIGLNGLVQTGPSATAIFGGDVKIVPDKSTNSLLIIANKQDVDTIRKIIAKLDIAKDQVYLKAIILEMSSEATNTWGLNYYKFGGDPGGIGRIGFRGSDITSIINPSGDSGGILGFGTGAILNMTIGGQQVEVPSLTALINVIKSNTNTNTISTPEVMALNNEEATIEVGSKVPVAKNDSTGAGGVTTSTITRENVTTKLVITPYISPDTQSVKMKIDQDVADISNQPIKATALAANSIATTTRKIKTNVVVNSGDTLVLGGLMKDQETEEEKKVPILGDIPVLGWLFKSSSATKSKVNLMVFITPTIVRNPSDSANILEEKFDERIDFIQRNMNGEDQFGRYIDALPRTPVKEP
jgi:general secretion pathway protein D